jgi:hypothetical protein
MNTDIEELLRNPRKFTPPAGLREQLIEQIPGRGTEVVSKKVTARPASGGWLRRWWPVIAPATVSVACALVLTVQQGEIRELKASNQALSEAPAAQSSAPQRNEAVNTTSADSSPDMQHEIDRLRAVATQLKTEIGQLQQLKTENATLRSQVAAPPELGLTPEETEALGKAKERAMSIACVNNLKQFGLAVRTWALDNNDSNPPNVLSMSNELSTPKVLFCPADTTRQAATDWTSFSTANCSYEFLAPSENTDADPQRVLSRCPIHGHIGLADGSVQSSIAKNHPEQLVERDGKLYLSTMPPAPPPGMSAEQMEMYRRRYGLVQPNATSPNSQPNATTTNLTEEQLKIYRQRYGIPPTDSAAPNQSP